MLAALFNMIAAGFNFFGSLIRTKKVEEPEAEPIDAAAARAGTAAGTAASAAASAASHNARTG